MLTASVSFGQLCKSLAVFAWSNVIRWNWQIEQVPAIGTVEYQILVAIIEAMRYTKRNTYAKIHHTTKVKSLAN